MNALENFADRSAVVQEKILPTLAQAVFFDQSFVLFSTIPGGEMKTIFSGMEGSGIAFLEAAVRLALECNIPEDRINKIVIGTIAMIKQEKQS